MRALITGASGFVGRALHSLLIEHGWEVVVWGRRDPGLPGTSRFVDGDLLDPESQILDNDVVGPLDALFHLAALMPGGANHQETDYLLANGIATYRFAMECLRHSVGSLIFLSSVSVIGRPQFVPISEQHPVAPRHPYALGKLFGEDACGLARRSGLNATVLRMSSPYGPGMAKGSVLPAMVDAALKGRAPAWRGTGMRRQDFIHVSDVARACLEASRRRQCGVYCLGSGKGITMRALAETIAGETGLEATKSGEHDSQDGWDWTLDIFRLKQDMGVEPTVGFKDGLKAYIAAMRQEDSR